jgi:hypothetical protein
MHKWLAAGVARPGESPFFLLARVGPTTPKPLGAVTVYDSMATGMKTRIEQQCHFPDASVDPTEARNAPVRVRA